MSANNFSLTIHMVCSLDGMIAKSDNSVSWFETSDNYDKGVAGEDPNALLQTIDCYVMGSHTYEHAIQLSKDYGWAYGDKPTIVLTRRKLPNKRQNVVFHAGELIHFVEKRLKPQYKNVWLVGGAALAKEFIRLQLADDIRISILPIILGGGMPLFDQLGRESALHLQNVTAYKNGIVELWYSIRKETGRSIGEG